jgi:hypothetical protein
MSETTFDRREFIAGAGALAIVASLPVALAAAGDATPKATLADWHIDDMWGVYPRPSEPIGFGRPHRDGEPLVAAVAAADLQFLFA